MLNLIVTIATIFGGISALWFFGDKIIAWFKPEALPTIDPAMIEKQVDFNYPQDSGLQERLHAEGYSVAWCLETNMTRRVEREGWKIVAERCPDGSLTTYRLKDRPADQILVKKRMDNIAP